MLTVNCGVQSTNCLRSSRRAARGWPQKFGAVLVWVRPARRQEQRGLQPDVVPPVRRPPGDVGRALARFRYSCTVLKAREQLVGDLPLVQLQFVSKSQDFPGLARRRSPGRQRFLPLGRVSYRLWCQRHWPMENVQRQAEQHPGAARGCSPSVRNRFRNPRGIPFGFSLSVDCSVKYM